MFQNRLYVYVHTYVQVNGVDIGFKFEVYWYIMVLTSRLFGHLFICT